MNSPHLDFNVLSMNSTISAQTIGKYYRKLGINIFRLLPKDQVFELQEDSLGVFYWSPPFHGDDKFYQDLCKLPWYYTKAKAEFQYAASIISPNASVFEIGCGNAYFQDYAKFHNYTAVELNSRAVEIAKRKGYEVMNMSYQQAAIDFYGKYDAVCSFQLLEHLVDYNSYFQSSYALLKKGGLFLTSVPSHDSIFGLANNVLNAPPHHLTRWSDAALKKVAEYNGFNCIDIIHIPVEAAHSKWFYKILLAKGLSRMNPSPKNAIQLFDFSKISSLVKLKVRIMYILLRVLGFDFESSLEGLHVNGHTVILVAQRR